MLQNFYLTLDNIVYGTNNQNIVLVSTSCRTDCITKSKNWFFFSKHKKDTKKCNIKETLGRCSGNNQQSIPLAFV